MVKKKSTKAKKNKFNWAKVIIPAALAVIAGGIGVTIAVNSNNGKLEVKINYAAEPVEFEGQGAYEEDVPTIDEIDGGGRFQDTMNVDGAEPALYYELGSIENVDTSSVEAFKNSTLGRCIIAGNYYGAQCVSLARAFWFSYAGYDVSTCGTGLAKGMKIGRASCRERV